nr:MAG TPA: hypothetical protein [Caudoviricetes sp.]
MVVKTNPNTIPKPICKTCFLSQFSKTAGTHLIPKS